MWAEETATPDFIQRQQQLQPPVRTENMSRPICLIWKIVKHAWMTSGGFNRYCDHLVISSKSWQMEGESGPAKVKQFPFVVTSDVIFLGGNF